MVSRIFPAAAASPAGVSARGGVQPTRKKPALNARAMNERFMETHFLNKSALSVISPRSVPAASTLTFFRPLAVFSAAPPTLISPM